MAARRGRGTTAGAGRLIVLGVLNTIALGVLIVMARGGGERVSAAPTDGTVAATPPAATRDERLERRIGSAVANALAEAGRRSQGRVTPANSAVAVHVIELGSGAERVALQADLPLRPASALKLFTCAAALGLLGADWEFVTPFEAAGPLVEGTLAGDLVARAAGDPLFREELDGSVEPWIDALAADLRRAGIERVQGDLVLDEGTFLAPAPGPAWPDPGQHWADYCALSGGFSANAGCLTVVVTPGAQGAPAGVVLRPRDHGLRRRGEVTTGAPGSPLDVRVGANSGGVTVRGSIAAGVAPYGERFAHPDPVALFGHALLDGLARRGIAVAGGLRVERGAAGGAVVARLRTPLDDVLEPILTHSRNSVADQLFFATAHALGERGDRAGGRAASARALAALGVSDAGLVLVDGSGLSRDNRVSARHFTALLRAVLRREDTLARHLFGALPVAGESGTLATRMRGTPARGRVHAKTGFINGVSALAGVARTLDGRDLAFALLVSYPAVSGLNTHCWKPLGDEICRLLVESEGEVGPR